MAGVDFRLILQAFHDAVVVADASQRVLYLNPAAERLLGWSPDELVGEPLTRLIPERLQDAHRSGFSRYLSTHEPRLIGQPLNVPALRRDGSELIVELDLNSLLCEGQDLVIALLRDPGQRLELERSLAVTRYLQATTRAAARLNSRLGLDQVLETVVQTLVADFDSALARIWLYEPQSNSLVLRASAGLSTETATSKRARLDLGTYPYKVGQVARSKQPFIQNNLEDDPQFEHDWVLREQIQAAAVFPILRGDDLRAVLVHFSRTPLPDEVVEVLNALLAIVTTAINDVELFNREQAARIRAEEQEQRLQTILDVLPIGVLLTEGSEGHLTISNPAAREVWGDAIGSCSLDELAAIFPIFSMDGKRLEADEWPLSRAFYQGERVKDAVRYRRRDGQDGVLEVSAAPFPGPSGGAVAAFLDVSARLRVELELAERAAQLKALLDHLPVGVCYFDGQCTCRASNGPARKILGRSRQEITGVSADELFAVVPELSAAVRRCVTEKAPHTEQAKPWTDPGGKESARYLDWRFEPLPASSSRAAGALALMIDITDHKRTEDALKEAKEAAERAARNKSRFLSAVSHDLRTPVNALSLLAELLAHEVAQTSPEKGGLADLVTDLRQAAANLIELVNDLLDLARFDSGDVEHHPTGFLLEEWLGGTLEPLLLTAQAKNLSLNWEVDQPGRMLHADRVKLSRVLTNLVGNAVKFTETGSVSVRSGADARGWLYLEVTDTGPGIPEDQRERIFDEFAQLRNPERDRTKGTGLGLAICKRLVQAAGGRLTVTSRLGEGSTFTALYPAHHFQESAGQPPPESAPETTQPAEVSAAVPILIVEDDPRSRQALARLLQHVGFEVASASDGTAALETLKEVRPSMVLLDLMMPGMDGMEVLHKIREQPALRDLPVVLLTGDVHGARPEDLARLGVAETLAKPVDFEALRAVIARHVRESVESN